MAKQIVLIKKNKISELAELHNLGVPISVLWERIDKAISMPKLTSLLNLYYDGVTEDVLFPKWLEEQGNDIAKQDTSKWTFVGRFPNGEWVKRNDT